LQGASTAFFPLNWESDRPDKKDSKKGKRTTEEEAGNQLKTTDFGEPEDKEIPVKVCEGGDILPWKANGGKAQE